MTCTSTHEYESERVPRRRGRWSRPITGAAAIAALAGLALLAAGCGGAKSPGIAGSGSDTPGGTQASTSASDRGTAELLAYSECMRGHGISDFPDPTASPGGGASIQIDGGPGSDLDRDNPRFKAANAACASLEPGGGRAPAPLSAQKIAAEVAWVRCMRAHGLPGFPDPNSQGVFDSSKFDESSPAFESASTACTSLQPTGPTPVEPGRG